MGEMSSVRRGCGRIEQAGGSDFDRHSMSGRVRGPRARGKVLQSGIYVAAVGDHAFSWQQSTWLPRAGAYTMYIGLVWVKKKGSENSVKSTAFCLRILPRFSLGSV